MTNVMIVGAGEGGASILKALHGIKSIRVVGICDIRTDAPGIITAKKNGIATYSDINKILSLPSVDLIIEATGSEKVQEIIYSGKSDKVAVVDSHGANLMMILVEAREEMITDLHREAEKLADMSAELSSTMQNVTRNIDEVAAFAREVSGKSFNLIESADEAIQHLEETGQVLNLINSTAKQTKLLGFNASIEAARSGEHGKGFAVVADEVRKLAEHSTMSVGKISEILNNIQHSVTTITGGVNETAGVIEKQSELTEAVAASMQQLDAMSQELATLANHLAQLA